MLNDVNAVRDVMYGTPGPLRSRINLYDRFLHGAPPWHTWVFDQLYLRPHHRVADLGCGPADLWVRNVGRVPPDVQVLLTDVSEGMLAECAASLGSDARFRCAQADLNEGIPGANPFHLILALHVLYHVRGWRELIGSMAARLVPSGRVVLSTPGPSHLLPLDDLLREAGADVGSFGLAANFPPRALSEEARAAFTHVEELWYRAELVVQDGAALARYVTESVVRPGRTPSADAMTSFFQEKVATVGVRLCVENLLIIASNPASQN